MRRCKTLKELLSLVKKATLLKYLWLLLLLFLIYATLILHSAIDH